MNFSNIMNKVSLKLNKIGFELKKSSPEILVVLGVGGVIASCILACKATTKLPDILEDSKNDIDQIKNFAEENKDSEEYTKRDANKDLAIVYVQTGIKMAKLYAPSVILGTLSLTGIIASNCILKKRNVALAAAYATINNSFKEYRARLIDRFGTDLDRELRYNIKAKKFEEVSEDSDGKKTKNKVAVDVVNPNNVSGYARFFDESCSEWNKDPEHNLYFLRAQQQYANDLLQSRGHLFLNEVYDMLGLPRSKAGQVVGWIKDNPNGDNFVDFGIYETHREKCRDFVNGYERVILLDFNVDGDILDKI